MAKAEKAKTNVVLFPPRVKKTEPGQKTHSFHRAGNIGPQTTDD